MIFIQNSLSFYATYMKELVGIPDKEIALLQGQYLAYYMPTSVTSSPGLILTRVPQVCASLWPNTS